MYRAIVNFYNKKTANNQLSSIIISSFKIFNAKTLGIILLYIIIDRKFIILRLGNSITTELKTNGY